jgi:crotonobetainyl-CoA:carnitine CoA-transferase CaiB-like acyl-CoA transferase
MPDSGNLGRPIDDVVVLEEGLSGAVSYAGRLLADLGATVVCVEGEIGNDLIGGSVRGYTDAGKMFVTSEFANENYPALVRSADLIIVDGETYFKRFEILNLSGSPKTVIAITPDGIAMPNAARSISAAAAFHQGGGSGVELRARAGDPRPVSPLGSLALFDSGVMAAFAAIAALLAPKHGTEGLNSTPQLVDLSIREVQVSLGRQDLSAFINEGVEVDRPEGYGPFLGLVLACKDGEVVTHLGEEQIPAWAKVTGLAELTEDARFLSSEQRARHWRDLMKLIETWTSGRTRLEVERELQPRRVPVAGVQTLREVLDDEQLRHREFFQEIGSSNQTLASIPVLVNGRREWRPQRRLERPQNEKSISSQLSDLIEGVTEEQERFFRAYVPRDRLPLEGIRILDFSWMAAGPSATQLLALNGATVIRVEAKERLDSYRRRPDAQGDPDASFIFSYVNAGKKSVCFNLKDPKQWNQVVEIAKTCDLVIENFSPGTMAKLKLGFEDLIKENPRLVMISASAAGSSGPKSHFSGYAPIFAAMGGLASITGHGDGLPAVFGRALDGRVGAYIALAAVAGVASARRYLKPLYIDLSDQEVVAVLLGDLLVDMLHGNGDGLRIGGRAYESDWITRCYESSREGAWVFVEVTTQAQRQAVRKLVREERQGSGDANEAFGSDDEASGKDLSGRIAAWCRNRSRNEIVAALDKVGIKSYEVSRARDLANDSHLAARRFWSEMIHPVLGRLIVPGNPVFWSRSLISRGSCPSSPLLGIDTASVMQDTQYRLARWYSDPGT